MERATYVGSLKVMLETRLAVNLKLGNFDRIKLVMHLEEIFDIELPDEALTRFITVVDIVKYLGERYCQDSMFDERFEALELSRSTNQ